MVNISASKEVVSNYHNSPSMQDERMQEFFKRFGIPGMPPGAKESPSRKARVPLVQALLLIQRIRITNAHVVAEADSVIVKLADKREFKAEIIGN